jgi:hypothetical protein
MSAIIAGKKCKGCGEEYYTSMGHPKWYDDVIKRGLPENETFKEFRKMQKSGYCVSCYSELPNSKIGRIVHRQRR